MPASIQHERSANQTLRIVCPNGHLGFAPIKTGSFAKAPKGMAHYAWFPEETIIQIHGLGPSGVTYVNPADDPRDKAE